MSNIRNYKWFNRFKKLCNIKQAAILSIILARDFLEISEETYFLNDFNIALTKTLFPASDKLLKMIYQNMGGKRATESKNKRLRKL